MNTYYYKNRTIILDRQAKYYEQNKQMINERNKKYFKEYYYRNQQKMITRSSEYQKKQRSNRLKIIKSKPIFDDIFIIDLTEY